VADIVAAGDVAYRLAVLVAAADRLALLVLGQFRFAAELDASRFGALAFLAGAGWGLNLSRTPPASLSRSANTPVKSVPESTVPVIVTITTLAYACCGAQSGTATVDIIRETTVALAGFTRPTRRREQW
jgi:hypothetical protein